MKPEIDSSQHDVKETESGFRHVTSAMVLNTKRAFIYGWHTGGRSLLVSVPLIFFEAITAVTLVFFDLWGYLFNRRGIQVIAGDYMPMRLAKDAHAPLRYEGRASKDVHRRIKISRKEYQRAATQAAGQGNFLEVARLTKTILLEIIEIENQTQSLFAMHRHLLESIGFAAVNGLEYLKQSDGKTKRLTSVFIWTQLQGLSIYCPFDSLAQISHSRGVGILENDVPYIPFLEKFPDIADDTVTNT